MNSGLGNGEFFVAVFACLFLAWFLYRWILFNFRGFPPGPIGFPLVGYLGLLFGEPHKVLLQLSKRYGKIFSLYFGPAYTIVTTDYEIAKELVTHPANLTRPDDVFSFIPERGGVCGINGPEWQDQRRFCMFTMRNLGMGRGAWENMIKEQMTEFIEEVRCWKGKPTKMKEVLTEYLSSTTTSLLLGRRLSKTSDYEIQLAKDTHVLLAQHFSSSSLSVLVPWLADYLVLFHLGGYHKSRQRLDEFADMMRKEIEEHMKSKDVEHSQDFIGLYLTEMEKQNASGKPHYYSVKNLVGHLVVLFFAGGDTTVASLHWLIQLMAAHPEVQKKVQDEIDEVIGKEGDAGWDDRKRLPYTMAAVLEMERYATVNRIFPTRLCLSAFKCRGYTIPRGSRILVNSWAVMHDPKYWDKPMEFNPQRFIRNDGKDASKMEGVSTFSFGKRNCPGETVALMTIFIYFTAIMQKFEIKLPPGAKPNLNDGPTGVVVNPEGQELCYTER